MKMPIKVKVGHPMLPARRVMKGWGEDAMRAREAEDVADPSRIHLLDPQHLCKSRAGWRQVTAGAMAHYYLRDQQVTICGVVAYTA